MKFLKWFKKLAPAGVAIGVGYETAEIVNSIKGDGNNNKVTVIEHKVEIPTTEDVKIIGMFIASIAIICAVAYLIMKLVKNTKRIQRA